MVVEFFNQKNNELAFWATIRTRSKYPYLPGMNNYFCLHRVHILVAKKKSWYFVLGIKEHSAGVNEIKKNYEKLAKVFLENVKRLVKEA